MIGRYYIKKAQIKLSFSDSVKIAITGSYGKTSVKNYLAQTLQKNYLVHFTPKSYNTPLGIAKFVNETNLFMSDFFIYEFGARRLGDINELKQFLDKWNNKMKEYKKTYIEKYPIKLAHIEFIYLEEVYVIYPNVISATYTTSFMSDEEYECSWDSLFEVFQKEIRTDLLKDLGVKHSRYFGMLD